MSKIPGTSPEAERLLQLLSDLRLTHACDWQKHRFASRLDQAFDDIQELARQELGYRSEVEETRLMLRSACEHFGDTDWDEGSHLSDILEKHLVRHLSDGDGATVGEIMGFSINKHRALPFTVHDSHGEIGTVEVRRNPEDVITKMVLFGGDPVKDCASPDPTGRLAVLDSVAGQLPFEFEYRGDALESGVVESWRVKDSMGVCQMQGSVKDLYYGGRLEVMKGKPVVIKFSISESLG